MILCHRHTTPKFSWRLTRPPFLKLAEPSEVLCFAKDEQGATDIIRGDRHPILRDWQGSVDMNALFATGVMS